MTNKSTLVGILVLGLVAAGVYWARLRTPSPLEGLRPTATAGQASSAAVSGDEALPDVTHSEGAVDVGDVRIVMSFVQPPPVAFAKMRVRVSAFATGAADTLLAIDGGLISFEMKMPMGDHRYSLVPGSKGWHEAEVILPSCPSGNRRWYATIEGSVAGRSRVARFRFDLAKSGS